MPIDASRLPFRPCVGILVLNRLGLAWIGRRVGAPEQSRETDPWWQMPQGGIDEHEDPRAAALRELLEETGMRSVTVLAETSGWHAYTFPAEIVEKAGRGRWRGQRQKWFAVRLDGSDSEIDISPRSGHPAEFDAWRWIAPAELPAIVVSFKRDVYRAVLAEFAPLLTPMPGARP